MKVVLIPVKNPNNAKQRLTPQLSPDQRRNLVWAMLQDVTRSVCQSTTPDRVVVVSSSESVIHHAIHHGWDVIQETEQVSESESVDSSAQLLQSQGASALLRLPADIPLLQAKDIDSLLNLELQPESAILVPSHDQTGTNALLRNPPGAFPSRFGENSLSLHQKEAGKKGVQCTIIQNPRIALDLDELPDLLRFHSLKSQTQTAELLEQFDCIQETSVE